MLNSKQQFSSSSSSGSLGTETDLNLANSPSKNVDRQRASKYDQRLAQYHHRGNFVRDDEISVSKLIDKVRSLHRYCGAANCIEIRLVCVDGILDQG